MTALSRDVARAALDLADTTTDRLQDIPASPEFFATVTAVAAGAASDGNALVTVTWRGSQLTAAGYPDFYTPAVGHRVLCALVGAELVIRGRYIGIP